MGQISALRIIRPANTLAVGILVLVSCLMAIAGKSISPAIVIAVLGCMRLAAGGYIINDVFDYETDKLIHSGRVLPRDEMSRKWAAAYALVLLVGSPLLFLFINSSSFINAS